jgi:hypothetical protein
VEKFGVSERGQRKMAERVKALAAEGWKETNRATKVGKFKGADACCLGCLFLPLALLAGHEEDMVIVTFERDVQESIVKAAKEAASKRQMLTLAWACGCLLIFAAFASFPTSLLSGLLFLVPALMLLPPTARAINGRLKKPLSMNLKTIIVILCLVLAIVFAAR